MSPSKDEDCLHCEDHMAREERLKSLECIPLLMSFMNQELGSKKTAKILLSLFIGIPFTILLFLITSTKSDVAEIRSSTSQQLVLISNSATQIAQNVAVMKTTVDLYRERTEAEHQSLRRDMVTTAQNIYNQEKHNGKR